jgi:hypothetical protein
MDENADYVVTLSFSSITEHFENTTQFFGSYNTLILFFNVAQP